MKKIIVALFVVAFLLGFGQSFTARAGDSNNNQKHKRYWSDYNTTVSWNEFLRVMKTAPENDKARIAGIPNSAPTNNEQVQALRNFKRLLLIDRKYYKKEMNTWRGRQSSAASQAYCVTEDKLNDVNRLLSIWNKKSHR